MIAAPPDVLRARAEKIAESLPAAAHGRVAVEAMTAAVGGGSLPGETLDSAGLVIQGAGAAALAARLRTGEPPVVGRVEDGAVHLDLRTVDPTDDAALGAALANALGDR